MTILLDFMTVALLTPSIKFLLPIGNIPGRNILIDILFSLSTKTIDTKELSFMTELNDIFTYLDTAFDSKWLVYCYLFPSALNIAEQFHKKIITLAKITQQYLTPLTITEIEEDLELGISADFFTNKIQTELEQKQIMTYRPLFFLYAAKIAMIFELIFDRSNNIFTTSEDIGHFIHFYAPITELVYRANQNQPITKKTLISLMLKHLKQKSLLHDFILCSYLLYMNINSKGSIIFPKSQTSQEAAKKAYNTICHFYSSWCNSDIYSQREITPEVREYCSCHSNIFHQLQNNGRQNLELSFDALNLLMPWH